MHSAVFRFTKLLPGSVSGNTANDILGPSAVAPREEIQRPPSPAPGFSKMELLSSVWKRLDELEDKVDMLQAKPHEMPYQKEELLNAAICRVDALEAELISTKKVSSKNIHVLYEHYGCKGPLHHFGLPNYRFSSNFFCCIFMQALYEALMKQEELLAYVDSQAEAKLQV